MHRILLSLCLVSFIAACGSQKPKLLQPVKSMPGHYRLDRDGASIDLVDLEWKVYRQKDGTYLLRAEPGPMEITIEIRHSTYAECQVREMYGRDAIRFAGMYDLDDVPRSTLLIDTPPKSGTYFHFIQPDQEVAVARAHIIYGWPLSGRLIILTAKAPIEEEDTLLAELRLVAETIRLH